MPTRAAAELDLGSFDAVLSAIERELERRWYSVPLRKLARSALLRFFAFLRRRRVRDLRRVTEEHVTAYARELAAHRQLSGKPYAAATQRAHLEMVQRLFRFLVARGALLADPTLDLVLPHWKKLPRAVLNQAQARKLVAAPDPFTARGKRDRAVLELLYGAAIRVGECERLDVRDLDATLEQVHVRLGKGRKDRVVPVTGRALDAVERYLREARPELVTNPRETALFITSRGVRLNVKRIQDLVRMNARAAGIEIRVTPHTLRHGCATHLLQGGADIRQVQALLGHSSVQTTAIYTKVAPVDVAKAMEKAHPRERSWRRRKSGARPRRKV